MRLILFIFPVSHRQDANSFGITVSCLRYSCSVSFSRFSAVRPAFGSRASQLVHNIIPPKNCQHLFATFFAFLRFFFSLRTDPRFYSILVRLIPNVTCHSIVRRSQKRTARTQQTVLHSNLPFRTLTAGENHYCASSIINRLASTSRTNCSLVIAPSSQRSRTYSMTRTPSEVSCSALPLRMYIAGAITFT